MLPLAAQPPPHVGDISLLDQSLEGNLAAVSLHACVYSYMHVNMCIYMCIRVIHICDIHACMYVSAYTHVYIHTYTHMYSYMYITPIFIHIYIYIYDYTYWCRSRALFFFRGWPPAQGPSPVRAERPVPEDCFLVK